MGDGIAAELDGIDLGDKRLNERSRLIIEGLGADPQASCNASLDGWSDTLAAYRFFDNKSVQPEDILKQYHQNAYQNQPKNKLLVNPRSYAGNDISEQPYRRATAAALFCNRR